jgi:hypothetical protein
MSDDLVPPMPLDDHQPLPDALRPHLNPGDPDEPISIYEGPLTFSQAGTSFQAEAIISLRWLPSPAIHLVVPKVPDGIHPQLGEFSLRLDDGTQVPHGFVTGISSSMSGDAFSASLSGIINERVVRPADGPVTYAMFLLPNFDQPSGHGVLYPDRSRRASRLTLRGSGWIINLDSVDDRKNVEDNLKANSGFGMTQLGRLEREDQSPFSAIDAQAALRALAWYVSFAAGRWTGPCLPTGFDASGKQVWQVWDYNRTVPFRHRESWLDRVHGDQFEEPFPGFMKLWLDDTWEEVVRLTIHWYIEANALEGSIVLTQTAFELLASAILVDHNGWLSQEGSDKLAASDRIRLLFLWAGIPTGIPGELGDLLKLARSFEDFMLNKIPDAASAMTTIRNTITHPTRRNREKFGKHTYEGRTDAWTLGMRNLELCLLKLFEHRGTYADRITRKWQGEVEPMPWC